MDTLDKLKQVELQMLKDFHEVCKTNDLHYIIAFGTMIGCVRHKGFIPWDDDIDVAMPYDDYIKFLNNGQVLMGEKYIIQDTVNDPKYRYPFLKIRLKHTCLLNKWTHKYPTKTEGIYIDVFPILYLPRDKRLRRRIEISNIIWGQSFRNYHFGRVTETRGGMLRKCAAFTFWVINKITPKMFPLKLCWKNARKANDSNSDELYICDFSYPTSMKEFRLPKNVFDTCILMDFENIKVCMPRDYDSIMRNMYGDYMKVPPENERKTHHFYYINFDKSYDELSEQELLSIIKNER